MTEKGQGRIDIASPVDEAILARLVAVLEDVARLKLSREEHRAVQVALRRAQSGCLTAEERFIDAGGLFGLQIVRALREHAEQVMEAARWLARPGPDTRARLMALSGSVSKMLGLDLFTFLYLVHVAHLASLIPGSLGTAQ